jgi:hypothetical protein
VAHFASVSLGAGQSRRATLRMLLAPRRILARRTAYRARLVTVARDAQGVQRTKTVPVRLRLPGAARRR